MCSTSITAALSRYSFQNWSSFSTLPFKILFHISGDGDVDIGKGAEIMNVVDGARSVHLYYSKLATSISSEREKRVQTRVLSMRRLGLWRFISSPSPSTSNKIRCSSLSSSFLLLPHLPFFKAYLFTFYYSLFHNFPSFSFYMTWRNLSSFYYPSLIRMLCGPSHPSQLALDSPA